METRRVLLVNYRSDVKLNFRYSYVLALVNQLASLAQILLGWEVSVSNLICDSFVSNSLVWDSNCA